MDREKLGHAISAFASTFLTVYVALRIGKAIGKRETIMEILANDIDRWREMMYPETGEPEIPDEVRAETIEDVIRLRREGHHNINFAGGVHVPTGHNRYPPVRRWWERDYFGLSVPSWGIIGLGVVTLALWAIVTLG